MSPPPCSILVIRRDNIGDLLCTTPLLAALRRTWPDAWIGVLANRYNAPILSGNPDINAFFAYEKAKHRAKGKGRLTVWRETAVLLWQLRRMRLDLVLCASPGARRFARLLAPRQIIEADRSGDGHETEITFRLLTTLGLDISPGSLVLRADATRRKQMQAALGLSERGAHCLAVHISARKPRQRWPSERHAELIRRVFAKGLAARVLLFWAPGAESDPQHPGDDGNAARLLDDLAGLPVTPVPTHTLEELVAGLSLADAVICSDGGAMHIAAALGKPIVCFFGNSSAKRWHPWGVPYELLQKPSQDVIDIGVDETLEALQRLMVRMGQ
jgi:ADP-heptose:LPS heptosyltransferase